MIKKLLKRVLQWVCWIATLPLYIVLITSEHIFHNDQMFQSCSQFLSLFPGLTGNYLRQQFYCLTLKKCSSDCCIEFGTILSQRKIELGKRVYIGANCSIGLCWIDDDVLLGSNVDIISGKSQHYFDRSDIPIREQGGVLRKIEIGKDSWLGNNSVVLANVGAKCVVGAGSVVSRDVEPFCVVSGNPAKVIKKRL